MKRALFPMLRICPVIIVLLACSNGPATVSDAKAAESDDHILRKLPLYVLVPLVLV